MSLSFRRISVGKICARAAFWKMGWGCAREKSLASYCYDFCAFHMEDEQTIFSALPGESIYLLDIWCHSVCYHGTYDQRPKFLFRRWTWSVHFLSPTLYVRKIAKKTWKLLSPLVWLVVGEGGVKSREKRVKQRIVHRNWTGWPIKTQIFKEACSECSCRRCTEAWGDTAGGTAEP